MSLQNTITRGMIRLVFRPALDPRTPVSIARRIFEVTSSGGPPPHGVAVTETTCAGLHAERVVPAEGGRHDAVILYLHGGAFRVCSARVYRNLTTSLARRTGMTVIAPDYRHAPEHAFPAAHDDALATAHAVLAENPEARLVVAGDSAGGGLALRTVQRLRDEGEARVVAALLISPWLDLAGEGESC